jgi:hypothetical protein
MSYQTFCTNNVSSIFRVISCDEFLFAVNREMMTDSVNDTTVDQQYNRQTADYGHVDSEPSDISVANLFVMQASFDSK